MSKKSTVEKHERKYIHIPKPRFELLWGGFGLLLNAVLLFFCSVMATNQSVFIQGVGELLRFFCFVGGVVNLIMGIAMICSSFMKGDSKD